MLISKGATSGQPLIRKVEKLNVFAEMTFKKLVHQKTINVKYTAKKQSMSVIIKQKLFLDNLDDLCVCFKNFKTTVLIRLVFIIFISFKFPKIQLCVMR